LKLDEAGLVSLDARVIDLVDVAAYQNPWSADSPVRISHLLEHTAGLLDMSKAEFDHNLPLSLADALKVDPESRVLQWPPGRHSSYSNAGAGVAAHAMEQSTKRNFEDYAQAHVFAPLGMPSASFSLTPAIEKQLATGYNTDGRTPIPYWHTLYRPFGGINVLVREMAPFVQMLLNRGAIGDRQFLTESQVQRMENPATTLAAHQGLTFGYGLGNYHSLHNGFVFHGHGGDADGYLSRYGYNLETGRGYFIVINAFRNSSLRQLNSAIMDYLITGHEPSFSPGVPQSRDHLTSLVGSYQPVSRRFRGQTETSLRIAMNRGRLYLVRGERRQHLIPQSAWLFRRPFEPVPTTAFIQHNDDLFLQGPFGNYRRID
jgi:CubicO group peptidase (beta-lactamase class C family)